ncbi:MAG: hypothetical protein ACI4ET_06725 [Bilifractor sp.]
MLKSGDNQINKMDYKNSPTGKETARLYADIINLEEPELIRPRQDLVNRAKIFAPYDALTGYDAEIDTVKDENKEVKRVDLSDGEKGALSDKLLQVRKGIIVTVRYFESGTSLNVGRYITLTGNVDHIDPAERCIYIGGEHSQDKSGKITTIPSVRVRFDDLVEIDSTEFKSIDAFLGTENAEE